MYLDTGSKAECFGCEGCAQICSHAAIMICEDDEGFRYPIVNSDKCVECGQCRKVCPQEHLPKKYEINKYVFGGYHNDSGIRFASTSGGAFSAIVDAFCDENYVVFGAETKGLSVFHSCIKDKLEIGKYRKSKYSQSVIGISYKEVCEYLRIGKKVLFSGTPCQVAGLLSYIDATNTNRDKLLTVEVVCEGVPSPLYIKKLNKEIEKQYSSSIKSLDYRFTGKSIFSNGRWDFEEMRIELTNTKIIIKDRWVNPFWSVWLQHLMSRPSCYQCPFTTKGRVADISLGDLWGVHLFCPELYGNNGGSSLVVCNTETGKNVFSKAQLYMLGHELDFEEVLKYQGPMKRSIAYNADRDNFMRDLQSEMDFVCLNRKWAMAPSFKILVSKYLWGNRQKVLLWRIKQLFVT